MNKLRARTIAAVTLLGISGSSTADDAFLYDANLKGITICVDDSDVSVDIPKPGIASASWIESQIKVQVMLRLFTNNVRFKQEKLCIHNALRLFLQTTDGETGGNRGFIVKLRLVDYNATGYKIVDTWSSTRFGWTDFTSGELETTMVDIARTTLEDLTRAWVKANP